jgi:alpha-tubulin suppressor-like RCC1 family protein
MLLARRRLSSVVLAIAVAGVLSLGSAACKRKPGAADGGAPVADPSLGKVVCWGLGRGGQIGNGKNEDRNKPSNVTGVDDATKLQLGSVMSCASGPSGLRCWGNTDAAPASNVPVPFTAISDVDVIATSTSFGCALLKSGSVKCWGNNLVGQLGNGKAPPPEAPIKLSVKTSKHGGVEVKPVDPLPAGSESRVPGGVTGLTDATAIALGGSHVCALRRDGHVVCWGGNSVGQLGDGKGKYGAASDRPVTVEGVTGALEIAVGKQVGCARTADAVWCWGTLTEQYPQSGVKQVLIPTPAKVEGLPVVTQIVATETQACARTATGEVWCWSAETKPAVMSQTKHVAQLTGGEHHVCARLESGAVTCWGGDNCGQLGVPDDAHTGDAVPGVTNVVDVAAGSCHTCVIRK